MADPFEPQSTPRTGDVVELWPGLDFVIVHAYSRAEAIADGVLIPIPAESQQYAPLMMPGVFTAPLWHAAAPAWTEAPAAARLKTILQIIAEHHGAHCDGDHFIDLPAGALPARENGQPGRERIWYHVGAGDTGDLVLTVGFPEDR
ncbi:hypothetical protein AB0I28_32920 [Phytomonospora sp. NPDC050363]|uniref:hypothetical protein n=1 Tax=Phytomonospora sp. NPDC050363 TaxID=3155642 RepID=UPI0033FDA728